MFFIQVVRNRPGGRLQFSGGGSKVAWLASAFSSICARCTKKMRQQDLMMDESGGWLVMRRMSAYPAIIYVKFRHSPDSTVRHFFYTFITVQSRIFGDFEYHRSIAVPTTSHTHTQPFNGPFFRDYPVSRYQKGKTNLDFTEAKDSEWQYASLHLAPDRQPCQHPTTQFFTGRMPFLPPSQQCQCT